VIEPRCLKPKFICRLPWGEKNGIDEGLNALNKSAGALHPL
jgi:hypothetical protein